MRYVVVDRKWNIELAWFWNKQDAVEYMNVVVLDGRCTFPTMVERMIDTVSSGSSSLGNWERRNDLIKTEQYQKEQDLLLRLTESPAPNLGEFPPNTQFIWSEKLNRMVDVKHIPDRPRFFPKTYKINRPTPTVTLYGEYAYDGGTVHYDGEKSPQEHKRANHGAPQGRPVWPK